MDDGEGKPSGWNTIRAQRVPEWFAQGVQFREIVAHNRAGGWRKLKAAR